MTKILFTSTDKGIGPLIRWATGEDCSHCAIQWDELVIHSNWKGVNITFLSEFLEENTIVHSIEVPEDRDKITNAIVNNIGKLYDTGALLFCGIVLFCRKALNLDWPKKNLWQSTGMYLCTEFVTEYLEGEQDSMITPHKLYIRLVESKINPRKDE